jgi:4-alpha-glucanotransferase
MTTNSPFEHPLSARGAGVLLHPTSLPGKYGIGDLGPAAYVWVDALGDAIQGWWQMLPLGPTGYGDSPYQCFSAFAGNPNLISPEALADAGLVRRGELAPLERPEGPIDYGTVEANKHALIQRAWATFHGSGAREEFERFQHDNADWLDDYSLFMALKESFGGKSWFDWPDPYRLREPQAIAEARRELVDSIDRYRFGQFLFFRQWDRLRNHAVSRGVRIIGDMPIFLAGDSADVWVHPELFQLDADRRPKFVSGVPPDYFSTTGQLWGNPLYDWEAHERTGFAWWIARMRATLRLVDLIRLDHFRGFEAYWQVPAGSPTAENGRWVRGPGAKLLRALHDALGGLPLIAEDLGVITPEVEAIRTEFHLPGMRILQFAFGGAVESRFLPNNFENPTVVYTGTHDNDTTLGWFGQLTADERKFTERYLGYAGSDIAWQMIREAWKSIAVLAVAPAQDLLSLGSAARMNTPGQPSGNWRWRLPASGLGQNVIGQLGEFTAIYQRGGTLRYPRPAGDIL